MSDIAIRAQDLSKRFILKSSRRSGLKERVLRRTPAIPPEEIWALRDATFEVPHGRTMGLIGPNGAGKSTALKVLTGIYLPTYGVAQVNGRVSALLELGAGFHPELTGRENIRLNASILGMSRKMIDSIIDDVIDFSGVEKFIDSPVKVYSSGMYARLGFAIAVKMEPEILIIDEIIAVGDEEFQRKCFDHMYNLRKGGTTIVLVSHSLGQVERLCDDAVWLEQGRVRDLGPAPQVINAYLDSVNEREIADTAPVAPSTLGPAVGSGEVQLTSFEVHSGGEPVVEVFTGEPATFRMAYEAHEEIPDALVGLAIHAENGQLVTAPSTTRRDDPVRIPKGPGSLEFTVPALALNPGTYEISTFIGVRGHWFDVRTRRFSLTVRGSADAEAGWMTMPGDWSVSSDRSPLSHS